MKTDHNGFISELEKNEIFCFGSNLAGLHIGGAAKTAKDKFGAIEGQGVGFRGRSYAIPTLNHGFQKLELEMINGFLKRFATFAKINKRLTFYLTPIGTGIAGRTHTEIKSILPKFSSNVIVDDSLK